LFEALASRLGAAALVVLGVCTLVFLLIHLVPGDPVEAMLGEGARPADRAALTAALGLDPRPGDREPVGGDAELGHQRDVLLEPVVVVARHVARVAASDLAGGPAERVPDRGTAAVFVDGPLDLVGGGGGAPEEPLGERRSWALRGGQDASPP